MNRSIAAFVLVLLFVSWLSADLQCTITGQVKDSEGAVIANARVLIHWDPSGGRSGITKGPTQDVSVFTDGSGMYSATVQAGFYDVFVSAPAFTPIAAKVIVKDGRKAVLNAKLYVDPLVSKEIGGMESKAYHRSRKWL